MIYVQESGEGDDHSCFNDIVVVGLQYICYCKYQGSIVGRALGVFLQHGTVVGFVFVRIFSRYSSK